jgi:hypothetical protein
MLKKFWPMFVLTCVLISPSGFGQETPKRKFDGGYFNAGIRSAQTGKQIPLFLDPSRTTFPASASNRDEVIKSVAANFSDLTTILDVIHIFTDDIEIKGKAAKEMVHIVLYPVEGTPVIDKKLIEPPQTFQPGPLKSLKEIKAKFGEPGEQELWSGKTVQNLGLNGVVHWWGYVGIAANEKGSITHVLIRTEPKK